MQWEYLVYPGTLSAALAYSFAHFHLGKLYTQLEQFDRAEDHYLTFLETFTRPDPGLLQEYVARQAEHRADATAAVLGDASLTYAELESAANRLARALMSLGLRRGDRV